MTFQPSPYQKAIFDWIASGTGNCVVNAVAGSGKTTTLEQAAKLLPRNKSAVFIAFNNHIVAELKRRLEGTSMIASTVHSAGRSALAKAHKLQGEPDTKKYSKIVKAIFERNRLVADYESTSAITKLVDQARNSLINPNDHDALWALAARFDLEVDDAYLPFVGQALLTGEEQARNGGLIDFTDMIYLPVKWNLTPAQADIVFGDEIQDWNGAQLELICRMVAPGGRFLGVGDPCQPAGTKVLISRKKADRWNKAITEQVNIEDVKVGDLVYAYCSKDCHVYSSCRVMGISRRHYNGELVVATMPDGKRSKYTVNHHCIASFAPFRHHWCVYVMRKGNQYRIGMSKISVGQNTKRMGSGPAVRMLQERADAVWVLDFYQSKEQAHMMEQAISGRFGISQLIFEGERAFINNPQWIKDAWAYIGDNSYFGIACLQAFGRDPDYPLFERTSDNVPLSLKRPMTVHASNLISGCLMAPYDPANGPQVRKSDWQPVTISREQYVGDVYSFDIENYHTYVADGIVTHNCQSIMAFAGSDDQSFWKIKSRLNAVELPLSVCYRCPKSHITLAKDLVEAIEPSPAASDGVINYAADSELFKLVKTGDLILCRKTAPLVKNCIALIGQGVAARVRGRNVGKTLTELAKTISKMRGFEIDRFPKFLDEYAKTQIAFLAQKEDSEEQIENLTDRVAALHACFNRYFEKGIAFEVLCAQIEALFSDDNPGVWLSTIHRAKGLEADRVMILEYDNLPLVWKNQQPYQYQQELNLKYVALTRAKKELILFGDKPESVTKAPEPEKIPVNPLTPPNDAVLEALKNATRLLDELDEMVKKEPSKALPAPIGNVERREPSAETAAWLKRHEEWLASPNKLRSERSYLLFHWFRLTPGEKQRLAWIEEQLGINYHTEPTLEMVAV